MNVPESFGGGTGAVGIRCDSGSLCDEQIIGKGLHYVRAEPGLPPFPALFRMGSIRFYARLERCQTGKIPVRWVLTLSGLDTHSRSANMVDYVSWSGPASSHLATF